MKIDINEYKTRFSEPNASLEKLESNSIRKEENLKEADTRAGKALSYALYIRKFEIELYWKRATYFWTFIAAAFTGYALTHKTGNNPDPWLSILFSGIGLVFSYTWYLVNRGSKFWQSNWEQHVDMLEDVTLGPLYKIVVVTKDSLSKNPLISSAQFSVSKLNQILSVFVIIIWLTLFIKSLLPISYELSFDVYKLIVFIIVIIFIATLQRYGRSSIQFKSLGIHERENSQP